VCAAQTETQAELRRDALRGGKAALDAPSIASASVSGVGSCYPESVPVRVFKVTLASSEAFLVDGDPQLRRNGINVPDIQMDERVRPRVALVFGEIEPQTSAGNRDEQREAGLELMLPLFAEVQSFVPRHGTGGVLDIKTGITSSSMHPNLSRRRR
jgi:hypothetical protein